jgi:hypothetical protein
MPQRLWLGTRKGLFTFERGAAGWKIQRTSFLGDHVNLVMPHRRENLWLAAKDHGHFGAKVHRSRDEGATWEECGVPTYPPQPEGHEEKDAWSKPWTWKLMKIWALESGNHPGLLWCGTIPGGLFRSDDGGTTWQIVDSLWRHPMRNKWFGGGADYPGIHSICVDPRDRQRVTVGVSCGGAWVTTDGGQTWNCQATGMFANYMPPERQKDPNIQDPHRVVQCPAQPDMLWAQHHNGVFRTVDNCQSWQEVKDIPPSVFGFAVAVHPRDGNTAWFIPAIKDEKRIPVDGKVVVTRTRDGGKTFDVLRNGLPQEHAYDLVFRHALDIDETGNCLAFGSTTGSAWISEDQGDHWQCLGNHLPPIMSVRFEY